MAEAPGLKVKLSEGAGCCVIMKLDLSWSQSMEHKSAIAIVTWTTFIHFWILCSQYGYKEDGEHLP